MQRSLSPAGWHRYTDNALQMPPWIWHSNVIDSSTWPCFQRLMSDYWTVQPCLYGSAWIQVERKGWCYSSYFGYHVPLVGSPLHKLCTVYLTNSLSVEGSQFHFRRIPSLIVSYGTPVLFLLSQSVLLRFIFMVSPHLCAVNYPVWYFTKDMFPCLYQWTTLYL
jgi:hypothetical protein